MKKSDFASLVQHTEMLLANATALYNFGLSAPKQNIQRLEIDQADMIRLKLKLSDLKLREHIGLAA